MSSAKKKTESLCGKCAKKTDCDTKLKDNNLILVRCLDFVAEESTEGKE